MNGCSSALLTKGHGLQYNALNCRFYFYLNRSVFSGFFSSRTPMSLVVKQKVRVFYVVVKCIIPYDKTTIFSRHFRVSFSFSAIPKLDAG